VYLTVSALSAYLHIKPQTIYYLVKHKKIPHHRISKLIRFNKDEIDQWMKTKQVAVQERSVAKIPMSPYTLRIGRPGHLKERKWFDDLQKR
jgi:excisionase family DNA binding protein